MRISRSIILPTAAFALMAGSAYAAEDRQSDPPNFNQMDKNNDGALTRSEAAAHPRLNAHFAEVDDNGDGRLTRGEYLGIMARQDLHTLRDNLAEFIDPEGKPPLAQKAQTSASDQASSGAGERIQGPPTAASPQLVRRVQESLHAEGIDAGPVDGIWGPRTHQALREFQEEQGLQATGQLNAPTLSALGIGPEGASAGASGGAQALFERTDKNGDGYVSRSEFKSMPDPRG